jgi:small subunit ribosomal protein S3Ae|tara:strand:- start:178 stop:399 length:222 start_codon:yes stop_codon:yes gene_type:complete
MIKLLYRLKGDVGKQIQKDCSTKIFPLQENSCMVKKVKILKKPRFDLTKLMELYKDKPEEKKTPVAENTLATE